ncbi:MAG: hypothetical protein ACYTFW_00775 [Planctomycetota bacterium]|jgi:hypothetical protein
MPDDATRAILGSNVVKDSKNASSERDLMYQMLVQLKMMNEYLAILTEEDLIDEEN